MDYCDVNILTSSVNRNNLGRLFGRYGFNKFSNRIKGIETTGSTKKAKNIKECVVSRGALIRDIGNHEPSLGAVMTFAGLKHLKVVQVKGMKRGKELYNKACEKTKDQTFKNNFCEGNKLKQNLSQNKLNDIAHFGSAKELGSERFITDNIKDFKALEEVSDIKIE